MSKGIHNGIFEGDGSVESAAELRAIGLAPIEQVVKFAGARYVRRKRKQMQAQGGDSVSPHQDDQAPGLITRPSKKQFE